MKKYIAGSITGIETDVDDNIYTDDFLIFYDKDDNELTEESMKDWALWLNSPWSQAHEKYTVEVNCKNAYTKMPEGEYKYRCIYIVVGYDGITATLWTYGDTPIESLQKNIGRFESLQYKYNPENESI